MGNRLTYPEMEERIRQKYPELAEIQKATDPMDVLQEINDHLMDKLITSVDKEFVSDLTPDEASAICYFTGANGTWVDGKLRFENCGLYKKDGKWGVMQYDGRY
jgi:hypothetical protein